MLGFFARTLRRLLASGLSLSLSPAVGLYLLTTSALVLVSSGQALARGSFGILLVLAGLRALSPAILAFGWFLAEAPPGGRGALARTVVRVAVVASILGVFQAVGVQANVFAGREGWWLNSRVFSTMSIPSTYAVFLAVALYFLLFERRRTPFATGATVLLFLGNIFLTGSGMGVIAAGVVCLAFVLDRLRPWPFQVAAAGLGGIALIGTFFQLRAITGRDRIFYSFAERLSIFEGELTSLSVPAFFFGDGMGIGTNVARVLAATYLPDLSQLISDSTVTALLVQFGVTGLTLFYAPVVWLCLALNRSGDPYRWLLVTILLVSLVTNVFELFPVNWIFFGVVGMAARRNFVTTSRGPGADDQVRTQWTVPQPTPLR